MMAGDEFDKGRVKLGDDFILNGQLSSTKFHYTGNGKIQAEGKDDIKKRLGRSPDRADAFVMGLYALSYVPTLEYEKELDAETDKVGRGTRTDLHEDILEDDYSGYNL
jgi:hypothetical protein